MYGEIQKYMHTLPVFFDPVNQLVTHDLTAGASLYIIHKTALHRKAVNVNCTLNSVSSSCVLNC